MKPPPDSTSTCWDSGMPEWRAARAGECVEFTRGISWTADQERDLPSGSTERVLRIPNVQRSLTLDDVLLVEFPGGVPEKWRASPGSIVMVGSNGNPNRVGNAVQISADDGDFLFASFLIAARPSREDLDERFLFHWWTSIETQDLITRSVQGTTGLSNLSLRFLEGLSMPLPPPEEQRRVAEVLDTTDETIQATERVIAKLELARRGLIESLIPEEPVVALSELASTTVGFVGPTQMHYTSADQGVAFLRTGNIGKGRIRAEKLKYVTSDFHDANRKSALKSGDVVVSRVGYTGSAAVIDERFAGSNCANMIIIRPSVGLLSEFLSLLFESRLISRQVEAMTAGSAQPVFNIKLVERLMVPKIALSEQRVAVSAAQTVAERIGAEQALLRQLSQARAGLAADLLSGRVRTVAA